MLCTFFGLLWLHLKFSEASISCTLRKFAICNSLQKWFAYHIIDHFFIQSYRHQIHVCIVSYTRACKKPENFKVDPIEFSTFFRGFWPEKTRILKAKPTRPVPELRVSVFFGLLTRKSELFILFSQPLLPLHIHYLLHSLRIYVRCRW